MYRTSGSLEPLKIGKVSTQSECPRIFVLSLYYITNYVPDPFSFWSEWPKTSQLDVCIFSFVSCFDWSLNRTTKADQDLLIDPIIMFTLGACKDILWSFRGCSMVIKGEKSQYKLKYICYFTVVVFLTLLLRPRHHASLDYQWSAESGPGLHSGLQHLPTRLLGI